MAEIKLRVTTGISSAVNDHACQGPRTSRRLPNDIIKRFSPLIQISLDGYKLSFIHIAQFTV
jgi:hypothetical protein